MGWLWTCFGGKKERFCLFQGDSCTSQRREEKSSTQASTPNLQSLGAHLSSAKEELLQPKQAVSGTSHIRLFKHKSVRRAKSCGNGTPFENGAKRFFTPNGEGREMGRLDQLQEEVEVLKKRLAEEEEEARKLRNEVFYLRSCGVLQSPDGHRNRLSLERESLLPKDDKGQRNWQSWLGLTLSPASRFKLEEQLRCMAADELSKIPGKGLTNGQKALIVATKLWQAEGDSSQDNLTKRQLVNSSCAPDGSHLDTPGNDWPPSEVVTVPYRTSDETTSYDHRLPSKNEEPSFKHFVPLGEKSGSRKIVELKSPSSSASSESGKFSFQNFILAHDEDSAGHMFPANPPLGDVALLQTMPSCLEKASFGSEIEEMKVKCPVPAAETVRYESPKRTSLDNTPEKVKYVSPNRSSLRSISEKVAHESPKSSSLPAMGTGGRTPETVTYDSPKGSISEPSTGTSSQTSDPLDHVQAPRFIDLRYQELEDKLLKSPAKEWVSLKSTPENSPPRLSNDLQPDVVEESEQNVSPITADVMSSEAQSASEREARLITDDISSTSAPIMKQFFACQSGRMWQPLSPVQEVDSGVSSVEDLEMTSVTQLRVSGSINSSLTSHLKCSVGAISSETEGGEQEGFPQHVNDMGEVHDDDLFTLSPRRLHHNYNPWDDLHKHDAGCDDECKTVLQADSGSDWAYSDEADLDDFVPIQCQSPAFSPKLTSSRNKFSKEKLFKVEEYARDKYLKDIGLNVEEFLFTSDTSASNESTASVQGNEDGTETLQTPNMNTDSPGCGKENTERIEILPVSLGQVILAGPLKEDSPILKKSTIANDTTLSQDFNDYPVLGSIENLPKRIECQGVSTTVDNSEIQRQDTHGMETDEALLALQDSRSDWSTLSCYDSDSGGEVNDHEEEQRPLYELVKEVRTRHQEREDDLSPLEFLIKQDETSHQACDDLEGQEEARLRISLHGFVYPDEHVLNLNQSVPMEDFVQAQDQDHHQNDTEIMMDTLSLPGKQESLATEMSGGACLADSEEHQAVELVDIEYRLALDSQVSTGHQVEFSRGRNNLQQVDKEKMVILNDDVRLDVLSEVQSLGYSIEIPKPRDSFSGTEDAFESPSIGGDSEESPATSRDGEETFHDCESPTPSESNSELVLYSNYQAETNSEPNNGFTSRSDNSKEEVPATRTMDISPDDRPILGTVATHWGENKDLKSLREWDGLGIPNSTSKFKEDQRVNWHTTPFETRLEQALSKLPTVSECSQRNLFGGVVM